MLAGKGDLLPGERLSRGRHVADGDGAVGEAQHRARDPGLGLQGLHPVQPVRARLPARGDPGEGLRRERAGRRAGRRSSPPPTRGTSTRESSYTIQVAPEDCTGCNLCVNVCPAKDRTNPKHKAINMQPQAPLRDSGARQLRLLPRSAGADRARRLRGSTTRARSSCEPLFEYSGACAGCGETPYLKLLTQLFGDRLLIANATGCSSIYGGNLPTTPYTTNRDGRGPAWANSLFEDNAEFGFGFRLALDAHIAAARVLVQRSRRSSATASRGELLERGSGGRGRDRRPARAGRGAAEASWPASSRPEARRLETLADYLVKKSVWLVGGDGWAYDIGYGGLDHVLANRRDVNVLVIDTEVYSNTGGQASKATPLGRRPPSSRRQASRSERRTSGLLATMYGHVYVARVAFGAKMAQTAQAFLEAEAYPGPVADHRLQPLHRPRLRHGPGAVQQKLAVDSGVWPLYRFDPRRLVERRAAAAPRLRSPQGQGRRLHAQRVAVPDDRAVRPRPVQAVRRGFAGGGPAPLPRLPAARGHQGPPAEAAAAAAPPAAAPAAEAAQPAKEQS